MDNFEHSWKWNLKYLLRQPVLLELAGSNTILIPIIFKLMDLRRLVSTSIKFYSFTMQVLPLTLFKNGITNNSWHRTQKSPFLVLTGTRNGDFLRYRFQFNNMRWASCNLLAQLLISSLHNDPWAGRLLCNFIHQQLLLKWACQPYHIQKRLHCKGYIASIPAVLWRQ